MYVYLSGCLSYKRLVDENYVKVSSSKANDKDLKMFLVYYYTSIFYGIFINP